MTNTTVKGLKKYGTWYAIVSNVLMWKPMSTNDTVPTYDVDDCEWGTVCSNAFTPQERKIFDRDMTNLFGKEYNGISPQTIG